MARAITATTVEGATVGVEGEAGIITIWRASPVDRRRAILGHFSLPEARRLIRALEKALVAAQAPR